jgi:hypothetical protein
MCSVSVGAEFSMVVRGVRGDVVKDQGSDECTHQVSSRSLCIVPIRNGILLLINN